MATSSASPETVTTQNNQSSSTDSNDLYPSRPPRAQRMKNPSEPRGSRVTPPSDEGIQQKPVQNRQEGASTDDEEPRALSLAELFGRNPDDENDPDDDSPIDSLDGLTKRLGYKPEQVYSIKVPMPNGAEALTIGELKDRVGELVEFESRETQFDQRRIKAEGELLKAQTEIREIISLLPKEHITPELVNKVRKKQETVAARERALTLEHIPDWSDSTRREQDVAGMTELLSDYGFDESFITTVVDHRAMKFIRDMYLMDKRIKEALKRVKVPPKKGNRPSGKPSKAALKPGAAPPSTRRQNVVPDQRTRIMDLFKTSE